MPRVGAAPNREDGWWAIAGQGTSGALLDVATGRPAGFQTRTRSADPQPGPGARPQPQPLRGLGRSPQAASEMRADPLPPPGGLLTNERPEPPAAWYGGSRWFQYYLRLWEEARCAPPTLAPCPGRGPCPPPRPRPPHRPLSPLWHRPRTPRASSGACSDASLRLIVAWQARKPKPQQNTALFSAMAQWHCRRAGPQLQRVGLIFVRERTPPPGELAPPPERLQVWQEECYASFMAQYQQEQRKRQAGGAEEAGPPKPDEEAELDE